LLPSNVGVDDVAICAGAEPNEAGGGAAIGPAAMPVSKLYPKLIGPTQPAQKVADWDIVDVEDWEVVAVEAILAAGVGLIPPPPPLEQADEKAPHSVASTMILEVSDLRI
jgi:hypothetical protein